MTPATVGISWGDSKAKITTETRAHTIIKKVRIRMMKRLYMYLILNCNLVRHNVLRK